MLRIFLALALVVAWGMATPAQAQMFDEPFTGTPSVTTTTPPPAPSAQPTETKTSTVKGEQTPAPKVMTTNPPTKPLITTRELKAPGDDTLWGVPNGDR